nr:ribonuclease H-like domain-containing protein [Tanacetum cinerariifolium]
MAGFDNKNDDASVHSEATNAQQQPNIQSQIITTKVIQNGNSLKRTRRDRDGRVIILPPTTADEHIAVQRESKAKTTLLKSIHDDHVADFHYMDDARDIWNAVKARFLQVWMHLGYYMSRAKCIEQAVKIYLEWDPTSGSDNESDDASVHSKATNAQQQPNIQPQIITTVSNNNAKLPYLKKDDLKRTRRDHDGRVIILSPTTADEHITVQRESKARTTLLQSIPDDHVADFHNLDDARDIWNAIKARFGGNAESKKMRKSMLKQKFSKFRIGKAEGLHKRYDRTQKILSQLNQLKAKPEDEDINLKFLRALPSSWSQVALTLKTKGGLELLSFDDLYYKLKTLKVDVKGYTTFSSSQSAGPSHFAFVSTTSARKKMSYRDSPSYSSTTTYTASLNSKTGSHRSGNHAPNPIFRCGPIWGCYTIEEGAAKIYNLITGADTDESITAGIPLFNRFAKIDSMKAVPPPLSGDYTSLSDHIDLDESQMSYGTKSTTSSDSKSMSNDFVSWDDSDKSSEDFL